jgi:hypothetical protein
MINKLLNKIWNWAWFKTNINEKAIEVVTEVKPKVRAVKKELQDVKETSEEVLTKVAKTTKRKPRPKKIK